jgi:hypothetical protein
MATLNAAQLLIISTVLLVYRMSLERPSLERPSLERLSQERHLSKCSRAKNNRAWNNHATKTQKWDINLLTESNMKNLVWAPNYNKNPLGFQKE